MCESVQQKLGHTNSLPSRTSRYPRFVQTKLIPHNWSHATTYHQFSNSNEFSILIFLDLKLHIRREHLFHLDMPTPSKTPKQTHKKVKGENLKEELKSGEYIAVSQGGNEHIMETEHAVTSEGQQVQFVVATEDEDGQEGTQTIVLGKTFSFTLAIRKLK